MKLFRDSRGASKRTSLSAFGILLASSALAGFGLPQAALAGNATSGQPVQGSTPFISFVPSTYVGGTIASVSYWIQPKSGSFTRGLSAVYSANYLTSHGYLTSSVVNTPVFGLYAGTANTVVIYYTYADKSTSYQVLTITTPSYTSSCAPLNARQTFSTRSSTNALTFDYFLLKEYCSNSSPAIVDTDGNTRWVGTTKGSSAVTFANNGFYFSDGATGINRMEITTGQVTKIGDYAQFSVTNSGHHNIDYGKYGLILDVNTTSTTESVNFEIDPTTGNVLDAWDMGQIISAAMTAGGDNPSKFVNQSLDWFHNNATAYNPADDTLIVSSRENFVMAVDYKSPPGGGIRKIHWILGDTTKAWAQYPSLAKYALKLGANTIAPIGQHAVSIDHQGNLLLFDDGLGSLTQSPPGLTRTYSAARSYKIDPTAMTATGVFTYASNPNIWSPICGSVYDVNGNYLIDFSTYNAAAVSSYQANPSNIGAVDTLLATGSTTATVIQGLNGQNAWQFTLAIPAGQLTCSAGWNALPLQSNLFTFN